jgi:hypothetical protein
LLAIKQYKHHLGPAGASKGCTGNIFVRINVLGALLLDKYRYLSIAGAYQAGETSARTVISP